MSNQAQQILAELLSNAVKPISINFEIVNEKEYDNWCEETMTKLDNFNIAGKITPQEFGLMEIALFES